MKREKPIIGWREWVRLPDLHVKFIKAKIDTGAKTSSLHAYDLETFRHRGKDYVQFKIHPRQGDTKKTIIAEAPVHEYRYVRSSSGHRTLRPVIITQVKIMGQEWPIELTLANRDEMGFRMLLGREALKGRVLVDVVKSYCSEKPKKKVVMKVAKKKVKKTVKKRVI